jgi:hypothetical protein
VLLVPAELALALAGRPVVLDVVAASALAPHARQAVRTLIRNGSTPAPALTLALAALEEAERAVAALRAAAVPAGAGSVPPVVLPGSASASSVLLTSAQAAELAGVTDRAVRKACSSRRLAGHRQHGRWVIPQDAAQQWAARREGRRATTDPASTESGRPRGVDPGLLDHGHEAARGHGGCPRP